jgi:hypothetical protein
LALKKFVGSGRKVVANESVASKKDKEDNIDNKNDQLVSSDFYENNLSLALCPKAELEDDCKFLFQYFISLFWIIFLYIFRLCSISVVLNNLKI